MSNEEPTQATETIHVLMTRVAADIEAVAKTRTTSHGAHYSYRGIDDIMKAVGPALDKHGVTCIVADIEVIEREQRGKLLYTVLRVNYRFSGPNDDSVYVVSVGEAFDTGDKGFTKAQSVALRTVLINTFHIPVDDPTRDTEHGEQHTLSQPSEMPSEIAMEMAPGDSPVKQTPAGRLALSPLERFRLGLANKTSVKELTPFADWLKQHRGRDDYVEFEKLYKGRINELIALDDQLSVSLLAAEYPE